MKIDTEHDPHHGIHIVLTANRLSVAAIDAVKVRGWMEDDMAKHGRLLKFSESEARRLAAELRESADMLNETANQMILGLLDD